MASYPNPYWWIIQILLFKCDFEGKVWFCILNLIIKSILEIRNTILEAGWEPDLATECCVMLSLKDKHEHRHPSRNVSATIVDSHPGKPALNLSHRVAIWQGSPHIIYIPYALHYLGTMAVDKCFGSDCLLPFISSAAFISFFTLLNNLMQYFILQRESFAKSLNSSCAL